jgi:PPOX class F420-dependent enzyme/OxyR family protein
MAALDDWSIELLTGKNFAQAATIRLGWDYLLGERRLGRLATIDRTGLPHVVPVGMWSYNSDLETIDVSGHGFAATRKFRNVQANPKAAFIVDDLASVQPWRPRAVMVQGEARTRVSLRHGSVPGWRVTRTERGSWHRPGGRGSVLT